MRRTFEALGDEPEDDALHAARIRVKRARYAAELAAHELGRRGRAVRRRREAAAGHPRRPPGRSRRRGAHPGLGWRVDAGERVRGRDGSSSSSATAWRRHAPRGPRTWERLDACGAEGRRAERARPGGRRSAGPRRGPAGTRCSSCTGRHYDDWTFPKGSSSPARRTRSARCARSRRRRACAARSARAALDGLRRRERAAEARALLADARRRRRARVRPRGRRARAGSRSRRPSCSPTSAITTWSAPCGRRSTAEREPRPRSRRGCGR